MCVLAAVLASASGLTWLQNRRASPRPARGPWNLGRWYRPLAAVSVVGCLALILIGMHPPNEKSVWIIGGLLLALAVVWMAGVKDRFVGPPAALVDHATSPTTASPEQGRRVV